MPTATHRTRRIQALLAARGMTIADLASGIGRSRRTLDNVITEHGATQKPTRQAVCEFLGVDDLWPGVKVQTRPIGVRLPAGSVLSLPTERAAEWIATALGESAVRRANQIALTEPMTVSFPGRRGSRRAAAAPAENHFDGNAPVSKGQRF